MMRGQTPRRACGSRNGSRITEHAQHDPIGINPALPFAPVDLFSPHRRRILRLLRSL